MALPTLDLFRGEAPSSISCSFCWAWVGDVRELVAALFRFRLSVCLWMQGSQVCQWNKYKILFSFNAVKFHRYNTEPAGVCTLVVQSRGSSLRVNDPRVSSLSQAPSEVGHRWRELEPKCVAQWFLGSLLGTHKSVVKIPEVFAKVNSVQFPSVASRVAGSRRFILSNRM